MKRSEELHDLTGRVALVVGGGGQIGFTFSEIFAEAGARVAVAELSREGVEERVDHAARRLGAEIELFESDITDEASVGAMVDAVIQAFGRIDVLVNCAHYKGSPRDLVPHGPFFARFEDYPLEIWKKTLDVNLTGLFLCCREVARKAMIPAKRGAIVTVSSTYGVGSPNPTIYGDSGINSPVGYATTKAAIVNFTRYLAVHLAPHGIRANCLSPGGVRHPKQAPEFVKNYTALTPLGRMAQADDYQGAALFLASDASSYMTGANLVVDGGWTAW
jgi:2-deoxy-D-gluconate 3-dehydrogenase